MYNTDREDDTMNQCTDSGYIQTPSPASRFCPAKL